jgi:chorismate mutase
MTTDAANDTEAIKTQVTELLRGLMKQSNLHFTDFFEAVDEARADLEMSFVESVLAGLGDCGEDGED